MAKTRADRKLYPGYVLVQMEIDGDMASGQKRAAKVMGFIRETQEKPAPITEKRSGCLFSVEVDQH
ncbi:MAG: transcription termination/antitermination NusG family protein [Thiotrichaceae bacterium]